MNIRALGPLQARAPSGPAGGVSEADSDRDPAGDSEEATPPELPRTKPQSAAPAEHAGTPARSSRGKENRPWAHLEVKFARTPPPTSSGGTARLLKRGRALGRASPRLRRAGAPSPSADAAQLARSQPSPACRLLATASCQGFSNVHTRPEHAGAPTAQTPAPV